MKKMRIAAAVATIGAALVAGGVALAQARRGTWSRYDVSREKTVAGKVEAVTVIPGGRRGGGLHLTLVAGSEKWDVHLGPERFVRGTGFSPEKGDSIEVLGSADDAAHVLIAREVKKGEKTYRLRDEHGLPLWGGGRRQ